MASIVISQKSSYSILRQGQGSEEVIIVRKGEPHYNQVRQILSEQGIPATGTVSQFPGDVLRSASTLPGTSSDPAVLPPSSRVLKESSGSATVHPPASVAGMRSGSQDASPSGPVPGESFGSGTVHPWRGRSTWSRKLSAEELRTLEQTTGQEHAEVVGRIARQYFGADPHAGLKVNMGGTAKSQEPVPDFSFEEYYDTEPIRRLMEDCFDLETLRRISYDRFREAHNLAGEASTKGQLVQKIIEVADRDFKLPELLKVLQADYDWSNQDRYQELVDSMPWFPPVERDEKAVSTEVRLPANERSANEDVLAVLESTRSQLELLASQVKLLYAELRTDIYLQVDTEGTAQSSVQNTQERFNASKAGYRLEVEEPDETDTRPRLSSSSARVTDEDLDELTRMLAEELGIEPEEVRLEFHESILITIALPGGKADELIQLDQDGKLEDWKQELHIAQLKLEDNLVRYIEMIVSLVAPARVSSVPLLCREEAARLKEAIASELAIDHDRVCFPKWISRRFAFVLYLSKEKASELLEDFGAGHYMELGIENLTPVHASKHGKAIFGVLDLSVADDQYRAYTKNQLESTIAVTLADTLELELQAVKFFWCSDQISLSFVVPSASAAKLLYLHGTRKLGKLADFGVQEFTIGQYNWDRYLVLVPASPRSD